MKSKIIGSNAANGITQHKTMSSTKAATLYLLLPSDPKVYVKEESTKKKWKDTLLA